MEEFLQLKDALISEIKELNEQIREIEYKQESYRKEKELVDLAFDKETKEFIGKNKKEIIRLYPSLEELFILLNKTRKLKDKISINDYKSINEDDFIGIISKNPLINVNVLLQKLKMCKELYWDVSLPMFSDDAVKRNVEAAAKTLEIEVSNCYNNMVLGLNNIIHKEFNERYFGIDSLEEKKEILKSRVEQLQRFNIFDENGNIIKFFEDTEELELFYKWMSKSIDIREQLRLIPLITKKGMQALKQNEELDEAISTNRENIIKEIYGENKDVDFEIDYSSFTEEEQEVIRKGISVYKELRNTYVERTDLFQSTDVEDKEIYYLYDNKYNWDAILYDIENNILPHLYEDKENVLKTFSLLIKIYKRYNEEKEKRNNALNTIYDQIDSYEDLIRFGEKYDTSQYDYVFEENLKEDDPRYPKGISREQIDMSYYLNHIVKKEKKELEDKRNKIESNIENKKIIDESEEVEESNINSLKQRFDVIYEEASGRIDEFKKILKEELEKKGIEVPPEISGIANNLVFFPIDIDDKTASQFKDSFEKTVRTASTTNLTEIPKKGKIKTLYEDVDNEIEFDFPHAHAYRYWPKECDRVGYIHFFASDKIKEALRKRYGFKGNFEIFGIIDAIEKRDKNDNYSPLLDKIKINRDKIYRICELLNDDKANIEELFQIIDEGISRRKNIVSDEVNEYDR